MVLGEWMPNGRDPPKRMAGTLFHHAFSTPNTALRTPRATVSNNLSTRVAGSSCRPSQGASFRPWGELEAEEIGGRRLGGPWAGSVVPSGSAGVIFHSNHGCKPDSSASAAEVIWKTRRPYNEPRLFLGRLFMDMPTRKLPCFLPCFLPSPL